MRKIERLAIKYFIIVLGVGLLSFLIPILFSHFVIQNFMESDPSLIMNVLYKISLYLTNLIVGLFILFDAIKSVRNKILIPILGFVLPIFGICFLLIENFLILKTVEHE